MRRRTTAIAIAAAVVMAAGATAIASEGGKSQTAEAVPSAFAAVPPGDLDSWMHAHCDSVQAQIDATPDPAQRAALQQDFDATNGYLNGCVMPTTTTTLPPSTTTSAPATTTTVPPTTTTVPPTTTTVPSTTTTVPPTTTTVPSVQSCGLQLASAPMAFCDTFSSIVGANPASRSGDLNAQIWGVSRTNTLVNLGGGLFSAWSNATLVGCGANQTVFAPHDVRVCNGKLVTALRDTETQPYLALYPKQPFDIAGRTGTVGFDVSDDSTDGHAAWPEFWWTDQPVPAPNGSDLPAQQSAARNSLGVSFAGNCGNNSNMVGVDLMFATRNYVASDLPFSGSGCVTKGSLNSMNHVELRVSQSTVTVYMSNAGSTSLIPVATATNANLTMTRGVIWVESVHYNGCKFANQCDHSFAFDNVGFDGPAPYRDLSFDVPDAGTTNGSNLGWKVTSTPVALHTLPVFQLQTPTSVLVTYNYWVQGFPVDHTIPQFRLNGGPWHVTAPPTDASDGWATIGVTVPLSEVLTNNVSNLIEFRSGGTQQVVSNVNVILIAGSPVT